MDFSLIGLSGRDKRVYEALLQHPQVSVRKIAEITKINRGSVFESIKDLVDAGLAAQTMRGKRVMYRAKDPELLHELLAEKQHELRRARGLVDEYIASFSGQANDPAVFHFATFYEGDEGLASILRDVLKTCRRTNTQKYRVISSPRVSEYLYNNFQHFTTERIRQELEVLVLRQGTIIGNAAELSRAKLFNPSTIDTGCYTIIYSIKTAVITIDALNNTRGIIIDNADYAAIQANLFDAAWQT